MNGIYWFYQNMFYKYLWSLRRVLLVVKVARTFTASNNSTFSTLQH